MAHPNAELVRNGYEAFAKGDVAAAISAFADDIVWHVPGRSAVAGDYHGPDGVMGFFGKLMEVTGGTFALELHDIMGTDDHVVALLKSTAERDGRSLSADVVHVWHVRDGKATEFWALAVDQYGGDEFFS